MKIAIIGAGYVGLSLSVLLSQKYDVFALNISKEKIENINRRMSPIKDARLSEYLSTQKLCLKATIDYDEAIKNAEFVLICVPTNFNENLNGLDVSSIDECISKIIKINNTTHIVIKSTIPTGFIEYLHDKYNKNDFFFSPEFLREGSALYDNLHPNRIVVGYKVGDEKTYLIAKRIADILADCSLNKNAPIHIVSNSEAESIKLFSNAYLAMRVAFFNELDIFPREKGLNTNAIISAVCDDPRIGNYYNNPSFG